MYSSEMQAERNTDANSERQKAALTHIGNKAKETIPYKQKTLVGLCIRHAKVILYAMPEINYNIIVPSTRRFSIGTVHLETVVGKQTGFYLSVFFLCKKV